MFRKQFIIAVLTGLGASIASAQITIPTVPIGNPGNAADPLTGNIYGTVAYWYAIGATEVTNAQYAAFLNAVARTDTHNLYNPNMGVATIGSSGGITRSGSPGSYTYAAILGRANNPVNWVGFWDSCRFANWLHNGQPTGPQNTSTTESGAYTLGGVTNPVNASVTRSAGWRWAVTNENEWYKAAYYQPPSGGYWLYPTSSNTISQSQANYAINGIGLFDTTPAGTYAPNVVGTFDMGGNVSEWNESIPSFNRRGFRGGSFLSESNGLWAYAQGFPFAADESVEYGFRVVQVSEFFSPSGYIVHSGELNNGSLSSLYVGDDNYLSLFGDTDTLRAQVEFIGTSPYLSPSQLKFKIEESVARSGLSINIQLWNYQTNQWDVNIGGAAPIVDSISEIILTTAAIAHVKSSNRETRALVTWEPINDEDPSQDGWLHLTDLVQWRAIL